MVGHSSSKVRFKPLAPASESSATGVMQYSINIARALFVAAIVHSTWHFGGTSALSQAVTCAILFASLLFSALAGNRELFVRTPAILFGLYIAWVLYATLQMSSIPSRIPLFFPGMARHYERSVVQPIEELNTAILSLGGKPATLAAMTGTVAMDESRWALGPYLIAFVFATLAWRLFQTSNSRRILFWALAVNASALALWGILQHAGGCNEILPGLANRSGGTPFSSFIYKNAGAAAIMPGLLLVLYLIAPTPRKRAWNDYSHIASGWASPRQSLLSLFAVIVLIGTVVSLSRGAWASLAITILIYLAMSKGTLRVRWGWAILSGLVATAVISVIAVNIRQSLSERMLDLSVEKIVSDQRWEHWKDGIRTCVEYFPSGSGIGTYGYATLPNQANVYAAWFREAHNQYLEVATESGVIGLCLVLACQGVIAHRCLQSNRAGQDIGTRRLGRLGLALLCLISLQSLADFVIIIPANLFLYSALAFVIVPPLMNSFQTSFWFSERISTMWSYGLLVCASIVCLAIGGRWSMEKFQVDQELALTKVDFGELGDLDEVAVTMVVEENLRRLHHEHLVTLASAALWERHVSLQLARYRCELIDEARRRGDRVDWADTELRNVASYLSRFKPNDRKEVAKDFVSSERLKASIIAALQSTQRGLLVNPLRPSLPHRVAMVAPVVNLQWEPWLDRSAALSRNDAHKLFLNGLLAFIWRDDTRMLSQWSDSIAISHRFLSSIFNLAQDRMSPIEVARKLVPPKRVDLLLVLADPTIDNQVEATRSPDQTAGLIDELAEFCRIDPRIPDENRYSTLAGLATLQGQHEKAADYWNEAIRLKPHNSQYRLNRIDSLVRAHQYQKALDQAVLSRSLNRDDNRFQQQVERIRRLIYSTPQEPHFLSH
jgi:O-antigen ligase/tetratricopeptide (TPR) repeat protein